MIYGDRSSGGKHGTVYTKSSVVDFMLKLVSGESNSLLNKIIIEPAAGDGSFAVPIVKRIIEESISVGTLLEEELCNVFLYEINPQAIAELKENLLTVEHIMIY